MSFQADVDHLLVKVAQGDRPAFSKLYDVLAPRLWRAIGQTHPDQGDAEDALQRVFETIWTEAGQVHEDSASTSLGWIAGLAEATAPGGTQDRKPEVLDALMHATPCPKPPPQILRRLQVALFPDRRKTLLRAVLPYVIGAVLGSLLTWGAVRAGLLLPV